MARVFVVNAARVSRIDLTAQKQLNDLAATRSGDDLRLKAALRDKFLDEGLGDTADVRKPDARVLLRMFDKFTEGRERCTFLGDQGILIFGDGGQVAEITEAKVDHAGEWDIAGNVVATHQYGVAICRRVLKTRATDSAAATLVVHHGDGLAKFLRQRLCKDPRHRVRSTACAIWHDQPNGLALGMYQHTPRCLCEVIHLQQPSGQAPGLQPAVCVRGRVA